MTEAKLQRQIQRILRHDYGWFVIKIHGNRFQMAGLPDLVCFKRRNDYFLIDGKLVHIDDVRSKEPGGYVLVDKIAPVHTAWLEVKLPGGRLSKVQCRLHEIMRGFGAEIHVVESPEQALRALGERE